LRHRPVSIANLHPGLRLDSRAVARAVRELDRHHAELARPGSVLSGPGELSLVFMTDEALAALHGRFLDDPAPTDVITFPGPDPAASAFAGEICISADAALRQLPKGTGSSMELVLYLVHGWLHLAGHDDRSPVPRRAMRRAESRALGILEREGALPVFNVKAVSKQKVRAVPLKHG
jgi:probable rRNA maturation factor